MSRTFLWLREAVVHDCAEEENLHTKVEPKHGKSHSGEAAVEAVHAGEVAYIEGIDGGKDHLQLLKL